MTTAEDTVRRGYAAFIAGDMELLGSLYTPDVVHRQPGHNQTSGEYKGVDDVIAFYGRLFELSGGTLQLELKSLKTSGDKVVSVHGITAQRDGKSLDADESIEFTLEGEKISRLDVTYLNEAVFDAFWGKA